MGRDPSWFDVKETLLPKILIMINIFWQKKNTFFSFCVLALVSQHEHSNTFQSQSNKVEVKFV